MEALIRTLIEDILTFAYCNDEQVEPDFAVLQLERISQQIRLAPQNEIEAFLEVARKMTSEAQLEQNTERAEQLETMPEQLGVTG